MKDENFAIFIEILKNLERLDLTGSSVEDAVIYLIDRFENNLENEQKERMIKEFIDYERIRRSKEKKKIKKRDEELYREKLEEYFMDYGT